MGVSKKWLEGAERVGANFENIRLEHAKTNSPVVWWCEERQRNVLLFIDGRIQEIEDRYQTINKFKETVMSFDK